MLKAQLAEALATIDALKKENLALSKRLGAFTAEPQPTASAASTSDALVCDLCGREVPAANLEMHQVHCKKNFSKCPACNQLFQSKALEEHRAMASGTVESLVEDVLSGNIEGIEGKLAHGADLTAVTPDHSRNSLLHVAAGAGGTEVIAYLLAKGLDLNSANKYGETPIHMACSRSKNVQTVQLLVTRGADYLRRNAIGESALDLAQRCGFHEAFLYLSQLTNAARSFTAPANRPGTKRSTRTHNS